MFSCNSVDLDSGKAVINQRMVLNGPHDSFPRPVKERIISLPEEGIRILKSIHTTPEKDFFFHAEKEKASTATMNMNLQSIRSLSGIPDFKYRDLTENFIIRCLSAGVDIASLENYFGYCAGSIITRMHINMLGILPDCIEFCSTTLPSWIS